ncbi:MAG: hypothetical protein JXB60_02235 [Candidatus Cloacimonetes bacterium]|nr:hypothetical protein [Candidatus Cloacimonadota bacterium]
MIRVYLAFIMVGLLGIIFVLVFGIVGMYVLNLGFLVYLIRRHHYDEREIQLTRRAFNYTLGIVMMILVNIYVISHFVDFGNFLRLNWVGLVVSAAFIIHGVSGLIIFRGN